MRAPGESRAPFCFPLSGMFFTLGEWGVLDVADVARAKLVIAKAVRHGAPLVVNADDAHLSAVARELGRPLTWISVGNAERVRAETGSADAAWVTDEGWLVRLESGASHRVAEVQAIPATLGGAALYNVSNALGVAALAHALGFPDDVTRAGLASFGASPESSPG